MRVERLVSYLLFVLAIVLVIAAFFNPIISIDFIEIHAYFKDAHREALFIYAAFISIPAFIMSFWTDDNNPLISKVSWLLVAVALLICTSILYLTYAVNPYDIGFKKYIAYNWYIVYGLITFIIVTVIYLIAKLFKLHKES